MNLKTVLRDTFIPEKGRYINSPIKYFRQSRFFVWIIFFARAVVLLTLRGFKFKQIQITEGSQHNQNVIAHNLWENMAIFQFGRGRVESLLWPLRLVPDVKLKGKTLCIGPKNEGELLTYWAHGFKWKNITGVDLFSYSPKIKVMDLHDLKFADNSFDTISCGWVLKYCYDIKKAVKEIVRVAKDGTLITVGFSLDKNGATNNWVASNLDGGIDELLSYFGSHVGPVYWRYEDLKNGKGKPVVVFRIKK
ncbi:MAG: methyltransferase domain-containing protein [Patescibacteria group bacterium]